MAGMFAFKKSAAAAAGVLTAVATSDLGFGKESEGFKDASNLDEVGDSMVDPPDTING